MFKRLFRKPATDHYWCYECAEQSLLIRGTKTYLVPNDRIILCTNCGAWTKNYLKKNTQDCIKERLLIGSWSKDDQPYVQDLAQELFKNEETKPSFGVCNRCTRFAKIDVFSKCSWDERIYCNNCVFSCSCGNRINVDYVSNCCNLFRCVLCYGMHKKEHLLKKEKPASSGWSTVTFGASSINANVC